VYIQEVYTPTIVMFYVIYEFIFYYTLLYHASKEFHDNDTHPEEEEPLRHCFHEVGPKDNFILSSH
jgi:hypothetical protein